MAADLVSRRVAVIVAGGGEPAALAAKAATSTIPIVFAIGGDPVKVGLVASLNRPGANVTGVTLLTGSLEAKRLGLLRELVPKATTLAMLVNPTFPNAETQVRDAQEAARTFGLQMHVLNASNERDFDAAFASLAQLRADALLVSSDRILKQPSRSNRRAGGAPSGARDLRMARVRGGRRPDELWNQPRRYIPPSRRLHRPNSQGREARRPASAAADQVRLVINLKTAKTLGLELAADAARPRRRGDRMKRREFITLLGGAAAWPLAARAQKNGQVRRVGVIMGFAENDEVWRAYLANFRQGLQELGWTDGRNIRFDYRFTGDSEELMRSMAEEVAALQPDVILVSTNSVASQH